MLLCWMPSLSSTPRYLYAFLIQLSYFCVIIYYYITSWGQFTFLETGFGTFFKSTFHTDIISELFHYFQFSNLFLLVLAVQF